MPWSERGFDRKRSGAALAAVGGVISLGGLLWALTQSISATSGGAPVSQFIPPLVVAAAALAVSVGGLLLVLDKNRPASAAFLIALAAVATEAIIGLTQAWEAALAFSPLESASFAILVCAGIAECARRRWRPMSRGWNGVSRAVVLWALATAGAGLVGWVNVLWPEVGAAVGWSATWWGGAVAVLVGLCLLSSVDPPERLRSPRTKFVESAALTAWIVLTPLIITMIVDLLLMTTDPASIRATVSWVVVFLGAQAAVGAVALSRILVDRELARVTNVAADATVVVDKAGRIVDLDDGAVKLFGWRRDEVVGEQMELLIPSRFRSSHEHRKSVFLKHPEHRSMGLASTAGLRRDGSEFEAEVVLTPADRGQFVSAAIWELKGQRLRRRQTRFRDRLVAVTEQSSHGFFIEDNAGIATEANDALCRMFGALREDLLGTPVATRCLAADVASVHEAMSALWVGQSDHAEWRARYLRDDGSSFWAEVEVTRLIDDQGNVEGVSGQMRDVSVEVAERDLRVATEGLLAAATAAAPIGLTVTTLGGLHKEVNEAYCKMTGYRPEELATRTVESITESGDWLEESAARARLSRALDDASAPVEVMDKRLLRPDGTEIWVRLHLRALRSSEGAATAFVSQTIDISEEKRAEMAASLAQAELKFRSSHDSLTGVRNRGNIIEVLTQILAARPAGNVGLLFMDLDRFKQINDDISHAAGDQVLVEVANRLRAATRANDCIGRIGGDEFIVVLGDLTSPADAAAVAEHIRTSISATEFTADGTKFTLTVSMGIAVSRPGQTAAALLRDADAALQLAKVSGRDSSRLNDEDLRTNVARRKETAKLLKRAVADGAIQAWFQPIVDLADRRVVGMEAVARWVEPGAAPVRAAEFIGIAEQTGLVNELGMAVIDQALTHLSTLPQTITMAVNVATVQLHRATLRSGIASLLDALKLTPDRLVVEVAEDSLLALRPSARRDLEAMVSEGVKLHVSGFGSGDSSLSQLRDFPVSGLKLDRSVVRHLGADPAHPMVKLATGLASLATELGLTRVAEGIETEHQARAVLEAGWTLGQGWLFGGAEPAPELVAASREAALASERVIHNRRRGDGRGPIFAQTRRPGIVVLPTEAQSGDESVPAAPAETAPAVSAPSSPVRPDSGRT